jgi:hypothetical protein
MTGITTGESEVEMSMSDEELRAVVEVSRILARYVQSVDAFDADKVASLFAPDGRIEGLSVGTLSGRDEIRAFFAARDVVVPPRRHHVTSINARIDPDGVLRSTSYLQVVGIGDLIAGVYEDEFEADGDDWLFKRKLIQLEVT